MGHTQEFNLIQIVVDKYFSFMDEIGGDRYITEFIPASMLNGQVEDDPDWSYWLPLKSAITTTELAALASFWQHPLPASYTFFLQQRYFMEMSLGGYRIGFFEHLPGSLELSFRKKIEEEYDGLLERHYLPFARFSDFGVLCFDATQNSANNEYPVVMLDHEDGYDVPDFYAADFLSMFQEFNEHLDDWIANNRTMRNNSAL
jgi:hypothetical protein